MSEPDFIPFAIDARLLAPTPVVPGATVDDPFAASRDEARFMRFRDDRAVPGRTLATLATLAAPSAPDDWQKGVARLSAMPTPYKIPQERWDRVVWIVSHLLAEWGQAASEHGWSELDMFGCFPDPYVARLDQDGLAQALIRWQAAPLSVVEITREWAVLKVGGRHSLRHHRQRLYQSVPLWTAYSAGQPP